MKTYTIEESKAMCEQTVQEEAQRMREHLSSKRKDTTYA